MIFVLALSLFAFVWWLMLKPEPAELQRRLFAKHTKQELRRMRLERLLYFVFIATLTYFGLAAAYRESFGS